MAYTQGAGALLIFKAAAADVAGGPFVEAARNFVVCSASAGFGGGGALYRRRLLARGAWPVAAGRMGGGGAPALELAMAHFRAAVLHGHAAGRMHGRRVGNPLLGSAARA